MVLCMRQYTILLFTILTAEIVTVTFLAVLRDKVSCFINNLLIEVIIFFAITFQILADLMTFGRNAAK